jgi:hypothetical protein
MINKNARNVLSHWPNMLSVSVTRLGEIWPFGYSLLEHGQQFKTWFFVWFKRVLDQSSEQRESKLTVLCPPIIIILISYIVLLVNY